MIFRTQLYSGIFILLPVSCVSYQPFLPFPQVNLSSLASLISTHCFTCSLFTKHHSSFNISQLVSFLLELPVTHTSKFLCLPLVIVPWTLVFDFPFLTIPTYIHLPAFCLPALGPALHYMTLRYLCVKP
ncbi:hypothetical protein XENOCAPTIV_003070 [Xenoophorus captivus]|uniref:Uncharacterized protein n=1 Tax=Xenoophorus captivus TaxID=1517983 RepID=A0ABV0QY48_9TELE